MPMFSEKRLGCRFPANSNVVLSGRTEVRNALRKESQQSPTVSICNARRFLPDLRKRYEPFIPSVLFAHRESCLGREVFCTRTARLKKRQSRLHRVGTILGPAEDCSERDRDDPSAAS